MSLCKVTIEKSGYDTRIRPEQLIRAFLDAAARSGACKVDLARVFGRIARENPEMEQALKEGISGQTQTHKPTTSRESYIGPGDMALED